MTSAPDRTPVFVELRPSAVFRARSGLSQYDQATFVGGPPAYGPVKRSDFGYAAMFQPRLRKVTEVDAKGGADLVIFMVMSSSHQMETWMDGAYQKVAFRRGDICIIPPGMETRWCSQDGQASAVHLHVSAARLADAGFGSGVEIAPQMCNRDSRLQQIMRAAARLDECDPLVSLRIASLGAAALLQTLKSGREPEDGREPEPPSDA